MNFGGGGHNSAHDNFQSLQVILGVFFQARGLASVMAPQLLTPGFSSQGTSYEHTRAEKVHVLPIGKFQDLLSVVAWSMLLLDWIEV